MIPYLAMEEACHRIKVAIEMRTFEAPANTYIIMLGILKGIHVIVVVRPHEVSSVTKFPILILMLSYYIISWVLDRT